MDWLFAPVIRRKARNIGFKVTRVQRLPHAIQHRLRILSSFCVHVHPFVQPHRESVDSGIVEEAMEPMVAQVVQEGKRRLQ
jgi:predicted PP-loop superfamily ATPase